METNKKPFNGYNNGAEMWRDNVLRYGIDEAATICGNYLNMNLKRGHSGDERQFCRELFTAMYEATANKIDPAKLVYPYDFKMAHERLESSYYQSSRERNIECARQIDTLIADSCYETNFYNLEIAAMKAIADYGFSRVNRVLAFNIQKRGNDGRFSSANKRWAQTFTIPEQAFTYMNAHAILIDGIADYVRKLNADLNAERFALPGCEKHGETEPVHGYKILRSIMVDEHQGYVIANNPDACDEFVCRQFYIREDGRHYNWGIYGSEKHAIDAFIARVIVNHNG